MDSHADIIERLGGYIELARIFDTHRSVTWRWAQNGIPVQRWSRILEIAASQRVPVTADKLLSTLRGSFRNPS